MSPEASRRILGRVLGLILPDRGRSLDAAIGEYETQVGADDRSLLRMLCFGTLRNHWRLQAWIGQLVNRPLKKRDSVVNALLAVGLFQLCDTRIPDHAAVSQTVEAARQLRGALAAITAE